MIWRRLIIITIFLSTIVVSTILAPKGSAGLRMKRTLLGSQILLVMISLGFLLSNTMVEAPGELH